MTRADDNYLAGFHAALAIAHAAAERIAASDMHVLRKEMAAEALRSFAEEAFDALRFEGVVSANGTSAALKFEDGLGVLKLRRPSVALADASKSGAVPANADLRVKAASFGYTGDMCPDCQNLTMVRNGTCLKCDTCGSTTGCS